ncbi:MAG: hypothetical protein WDN48_02390 [Pseudolabrys sp.]
MSLARMNQDERASYFIGQAVLRQLEKAPRDPETLREIEAIARWITHWLTDDEYAHVVMMTGIIFDQDDADAIMGVGESDEAPRPAPSDDDTPF